ncbi:MAG: alkaline phosphatase family protein [Sulfuricellaceae bacterium]
MRFLVFLLSISVLIPAYGKESATPIKHLVVLFQENNSFDHYFATYPKAANPPGEPAFNAVSGTPTVNGLNETLLHNNRNSVKPFRLSRQQAATFDHIHETLNEQRAYNRGLLDGFVEHAGNSKQPGQVMGYFDGNTVTALWNYAQNFAMSDNFFGTTFGPSSIGAINLISGQTAGASSNGKKTVIASKGKRIILKNGVFISNSDPEFDDCSNPATPPIRFSGKNVGNLMNQGGVSWGWFAGGFKPTTMNNGKAVCGQQHMGSDGRPVPDYLQHHEPFQYYASTANPHHLPPSSKEMIGHQDQANHQYDLVDFWDAADSGNLPSVSFLKAPSYRDGHAGYSNPLAEQTYLVETINRLQRLPEWKSMAIFIAYDDSDGWYDHVMPPIVNASSDKDIDALTGVGHCGKAKKGDQHGRCGYGPRLPFLVISPYAKQNFVDHSLADQTSIIRFIEENWGLEKIGGGSFDEKAGSLAGLFDFSREGADRRLFLNPSTGQLEN